MFFFLLADRTKLEKQDFPATAAHENKPFVKIKTQIGTGDVKRFNLYPR